MSVSAEDYNTVITLPNCGPNKTGRMVGYFALPVAVVQLPDGTIERWYAQDCRQATPEEEEAVLEGLKQIDERKRKIFESTGQRTGAIDVHMSSRD